MRKFLHGLSYFLSIAFFILVIKWEDVKEVVGSAYLEGDGFFSFLAGLPLLVISTISSYFENWDGWTKITSLLLLIFLLIIFAGLDLFLTKKIEKKSDNYFVSLLGAPWFSLFVQKIIVSCIVLGVFMSISHIAVKLIGVTNTVSMDDLSGKTPAIVLGTSKYLSDGQNINLYYKYRIDAAVDLYKNGKVSMFILSGDKTDSTGYDEVADMERDLIAAGVNPAIIKKDGAGYRTLDSILRIRSLYKLKEYLIISQKFHTERALILSYFYGTEAKAYNAKGSATNAMLKREILARPKAILDMLVFNMQPKVGSDEYKYRSEFAVNNNKSGWLVLLLGVAFIYIVWVIFNVLENNTEAVGKKLKIAGVFFMGSIFLTISAYKNLDIESLNNIVKGVSEITGGVFEASVARKEEQKRMVKEKNLEIAKAVIERGEAEAEDIAEDFEFDSEELSEIMIEENLTLDSLQDSLSITGNEVAISEPDRNNPSSFNGDSFVNQEPQSKKEKKIIEKEDVSTPVDNIVEEKEEFQSSGFSSGSNFDNNKSFSDNKSNESNRKVYGETTSKINAVVYGEHTLSDGKPIRLRLRQAAIINGESFPKNHIFSSKVKIEGKRLLVSIDEITTPSGQIIPTNLNVFDLDGVKGIKLNISNDQLEKLEKAKKKQVEEKEKGLVSFNGFPSKDLTVNVQSNYEIILK